MSSVTPPNAAARSGGIRRRPWPLWGLPALLSLVFVAGVLAWAHRNGQDERDELRRTMVSDALSLEARLRDQLETERVRLVSLASLLGHERSHAGGLAAHDEVTTGLRGSWLSVTWLDERNRIVEHVPPQQPVPGPQVLAGGEDAGLSLHLTAPVPGREGRAAGSLIVRYSPALLLRRGVPWWLARRYDVQLIDASDLVIASTADSVSRAAGESWRVSLGEPLGDAALQLTERDAPQSWLAGVPLVLIAGFLLLIGVATMLLRRQVRQVTQAELVARREAAWRAAMEDSALVGLRARDSDGRVLYVNRTFCEMVGYPARELLGRHPPMPYWPPDAMDATMERLRRNLAGQAPRSGYEASWRHRDGHVVEVTVFESPLLDPVGEQVGWMGSIIDITGRKQLEERERRRTETLAHHARLTMLGEVASTLAHELNQPLMAISSYTAGIANSLQRQGHDDPLVQGALQRLGQQAAHAGRIVLRIREFLTRREPEPEACDLNRLITEAVALLERELQRKGVQLGLALAADLPAVRADGVLVEQVVMNLVRNAIDALAGQGADHLPGDHAGRERRLRVTTRLVRPRVNGAGAAAADGDVAPGEVTPGDAATSAATGFVRVDVTDNGPGVGARSIEALCAPFFSTKRDGMGMGLAICRSIVDLHNGALDVEPAPGGGACFTFSLPLFAPAGGGTAPSAGGVDQLTEEQVS